MLELDNVIVSFDNRYGLPARELVKYLRRKMNVDGNVRLIVCDGIAQVIRVISGEEETNPDDGDGWDLVAVEPDGSKWVQLEEAERRVCIARGWSREHCR
ncbi:MAG: hypothetical protein JXR84_04270 [Anaerolineae bacterium]|nr:hypothetical protein [Anaerolineae bacterium]